MRRRHVLAGLLFTLAAPLAAEAQQTGKIPRLCLSQCGSDSGTAIRP
jgi:hypothetical protein